MSTINVALSGGDFNTIQAAIDAANPGDTIVVAAGTYAENIVVDKDLTIVGSGDDVILQGTWKSANGLGATDSVADFLKTATSYSQDLYNPSNYGVQVVADGVSISNIKIAGFAVGLSIETDTANLALDGVSFDGNVFGVQKQASADLSGLTITGGSITDSYIGVYFYKASGDLDGIATGVSIDGTSFDNITQKGLYLETLSNSTIENITMNDVGQYGGGPAFGANGANGAGIDINLKFENYSNITIQGFQFTDVGLSNGLGASHANAAAIAVKARDDGASYSGNPATYAGELVIQNGSIDGTSTGIRAGEAGKNVADPAVTITDVTISNAVNSAAHGEVDNVTQSVMTVNLVDGGDTLSVREAAVGTYAVNGGDGDDTIIGVRATDTVTGGDGTDEVQTRDDFVLASDVENLTLLDAASNVEDFEDFALGPIANGENGWKFVGTSDQQVVADAGDQAFQMSSDPTTGSFGGPYTPTLAVSAGESSTTAGADSMQVTFKVKAVSPGDNSRLEVDFGNQAQTDRLNFMVIENTAAGLRVATAEPRADGVWETGDVDNDFAAFTGNRTLIEGLDNSVEHQITLVLNYVDGSDNDVISVYVDGAKVGETTSFENFREFHLGQDHDTAQQANQASTLFFRNSAGGAPTDGAGGQNQGFLFDDISYSSFNKAGPDGTGNAAANVIEGNSGDNTLSGLGGEDTLFGGIGDDTLVGGDGDDLLDGGIGFDTAVFSGDLDDFNFVSGSLTVVDGTSNGGTDTITGIEVAQFDDGRVLIVGEGSEYTTIQSAIDAAVAGDTIYVSAGIYSENISITSSNLTILSVGGRDSVTINPLDGSLDAIRIAGASNVQIGDTDHGFTIIGGDGPAGIERSAITLTGVSGIVIRGNEIVANGDAALTGEVGGVSNSVIEGNIFSGQTFDGPGPAGSHFSQQFTLDNYPRQLIVINAGTNVTFSDNEVSGTVGGVSTTTNLPHGNQLVTIDASNSTISGNTFTGFTAPGAAALRVGGNNQIVTDNVIDNDVNDSGSAGIVLRASVTTATFTGNSFNGSQLGDAAAMTPGDDVLVGNAGTDMLFGGAGDDSFTGGDGADTLNGGNGTDTANYGVGAIIARDANGHWTVTANGTTDSLTGIERVVVDGKVYLLVDNVGSDDGFTTLSAALASASGGETILIAPGTYLEDGRANTSNIYLAGIEVTQANITLQGVKADGSYVTSSADVAATITSNYASADATSFKVSGTGFTANGLGFDTPASLPGINNGGSTKALLSLFSDDAEVTNSTFVAGKSSFAIEVNGNSIDNYEISGNVIGAPIWLLAGAGDGGQDEIVANNHFSGVTGYSAGIFVFGGNVASYAPDSPTLPGNVSGNTFAAGLAVPLFVRSHDATDPNGLLSVDQVEEFVEGNLNGAAGTHAYVLDANGDLRLVPVNGQPGVSDAFVAQSIVTLAAFDAGSTAIDAGDTVVVKTVGATNVTLNDNNLTILAAAGSNDLNVTLGATASVITLVDYAPDMGANVDVTGNVLDNTITGNSGDNVLAGGGGNDQLIGADGDDTLSGDAGVDELDGGDGNDTMNGGAGNDIFDGGDGNDTMNGDGNADTFHFSAGSDTASGGNGIDTIVLAGMASDYTIAINNAGLGNYTFTRISDGAVTVATSIERIQFVAPQPGAMDDTLSVATDGVRVLDVLANDTPAGTLDVIAASLQAGAEGSVSVGAGGDSISYDLTDDYVSLGAGETASATIDYLVMNGSGQVDGATATVTITGVDDQVLAPTDADAAANSVAENAAIGTVVGIDAVATDVDTNDVVTYELVNPTGEFAIDATTGVVTVAGAIDAEMGLTRDVTVRAVSTNGEGGTTTADTIFTVDVSDVDEFAVTTPVDVAGAVGGSVTENAAAATLVDITASATDADATNNTVTYSLDDDAGGRFAIDANTGVVRTSGTIDRETDGASLDIVVRATSSDGSSTSTAFTVAIDDANEAGVTTPVDADAAANAITENAAVGTLVGITASATDADATDTVSYSIVGTNAALFAVDAAGVVTVADVISAEDGLTQTVTVRATSSDGSFEDQTFNVTVADEDEFNVSIPVDSDATANSVAGDAVAGTYTGVDASALDADATDNTVTYSLALGDDEFDIDATTGQVTVSALNSSGGATRTITVLASSSDGSAAQANFTIAVTGTGQTITGDASNNTINGTAFDDTISGLGGIDRLSGNAGNDYLDGGDGNDFLDGGLGDDTMVGGSGNDTYTVNSTADVVTELAGGGTADLVNSSVSITTLYANVEKLTLTGTADLEGNGNALANVMVGNSGNNAMDGGAGNDNIKGGLGNDTIKGGLNNDTLFGDAGTDTLYGGLGRDNLTGGTGDDTFVFDTAFSGTNTDKILDFTSGADEIHLLGSLVTQLGGSVEAGELAFGTVAADADDHLVYDQATGRLWYDTNGSGAGGSQLVAQLQANAVLVATDFAIV